jgi:hypothetical protein
MPNIPMLHVIAQKLRVIPANSTGNGVKIVDLEELYEATLNAGITWSNELRRLWGKDACKARFDERAISTPLLRQLHDAYRTAETVYREALITDRDLLPQSTIQPKAKRNSALPLCRAA